MGYRRLSCTALSSLNPLSKSQLNSRKSRRNWNPSRSQFYFPSIFTNEGENAVAIDFFDHQSRNIDQSGLGSRGIFKNHLRREGVSDHAEIITGDSLFLNLSHLAKLNRPARFIHIDGGQYVEAICSDLILRKISSHHPLLSS